MLLWTALVLIVRHPCARSAIHTVSPEERRVLGTPRCQASTSPSVGMYEPGSGFQERAAGDVAVGCQHQRRRDRNEEPFVRIDGNGIRQLDAAGITGRIDSSSIAAPP